MNLLNVLSSHVRATFRPEVMTDLVSGGLFRFQASRYQDPVLVSGTDGVLAPSSRSLFIGQARYGRHRPVATGVNDIAVSGAELPFFLDYFATGKLSLKTAEAVVRGIADGCRQGRLRLDRRRDGGDAFVLCRRGV
ncbi:MAG: AIR synthase related protein [Nitrospiraceae bacterium]